jgi:hypothetical protein
MRKSIKYLLVFIGILVITGSVISVSIEGNATDIKQAYSETDLYENAIEKSNTNKTVIDKIGNIEKIDMLAILEGNTIYTNNNKAVKTSIRINGYKGKGKIDISATKVGKDWKYDEIKIRIKNPKQEIYILRSSK